MTTTLRKIAGLSWLVVPPFLLSAILHMADPEVDGWRGLTANSIFWSVLLLGLMAAGCVLICMVVLVEFGRFAFLCVSGLFAVASGLALGFFASGATTPLGVSWTVVGGGGVVFVVVLLAVIPAVVLGWPASRRNSAGYVG